MTGTHRKYVDPSKAVEILKEAFASTSAPDSQQVLEVTRIFCIALIAI